MDLVAAGKPLAKVAQQLLSATLVCEWTVAPRWHRRRPPWRRRSRPCMPTPAVPTAPRGTPSRGSGCRSGAAANASPESLRMPGSRGVPSPQAGNKPAPAIHPTSCSGAFTADAIDRVSFIDITQHRVNDGSVYCCAVVPRAPGGRGLVDRSPPPLRLIADVLQMACWHGRQARGPSTPTAARIEVLVVRSPPARSRPGRIQSRRRHRGVVLVHHATRAGRPARLDHPGRARRRGLPMKRGLAQLPLARLSPRLPLRSSVQARHTAANQTE
jgi:hypothetical protein